MAIDTITIRPVIWSNCWMIWSGVVMEKSFGVVALQVAEAPHDGLHLIEGFLAAGPSWLSR